MLKSFRPPPTPRDEGFLSEERVVFRPDAADEMWAGANLLVKALRPTLGPTSRTVLAERNIGRHFAPDALSDGGTIARRIIALANPNADVGAMLLRHALCRVHERAGDGVATTAVLFQAIMQRARRILAAGGNPMRLRDGVVHGAQIVAEELGRQAQPLPEGDVAVLHAWLRAHCDDLALGEVMAAITTSFTPDVNIHVENGASASIEYEFIRGALWRSGWHGSPFAASEYAANLMLRLPDAYVLVSDLDLSDEAHMEPLILALARLRPARLLVICRRVSPQMLALFAQARQKGIGDAVFVKPPATSGPDRAAVLTDAAILTGATFIPYIEAREGTTPIFRLADLLPSCLGRARMAWASEHFFGIEDGCGDRAVQIAHLAKLDAAGETEDDPARVRFYRDRMATFGSGVVRLKVGAHTNAEREHRKAQAERLAGLLSQVRRYGVVSGAGVALVRCERSLQRAARQSNEEMRLGLECVLGALAAPARAIAENAGMNGAAMVQCIRAAKRRWGVDVLSGQMVNLYQRGILDSAYALQTAVLTAASAAATFMTTDVIVHRRQREASIRP
ncbi:MAG: TCP-1/cpn60 chaperonin family protein [Candidatus Brachytrichaceae bacterium NZ_4S206]|jgi:chaperonin GroEL